MVCCTGVTIAVVVISIVALVGVCLMLFPNSITTRFCPQTSTSSRSTGGGGGGGGQKLQGPSPTRQQDQPAKVPLLQTQEEMDAYMQFPGVKFIYFFSPRCGFCKTMSPVVDDVFSANPATMLRAVNITQIKAPPAFKMPGVPYMFKLDGPNVVDTFTGARDFANIAQFFRPH